MYDPSNAGPVYNRIKIKDVFATFQDVGFEYIFLFDQWSHTTTETCDNFKVVTVWEDTDGTEYIIEMFESLIYASSSRIIDCVIQSTEFSTTPRKISISSGSDDISIKIPKTNYQSRGNDCADTNFYSVFAKNADDLELNPQFITVAENGSELELTFDQSFDGAYAELKFAVYVVITNQANPLVTNWYCRMVTPCPDGTGTCPSYQSSGDADNSYTLC